MSLARSRYSPMSAQESLAGNPPSTKPPRILLAEDDAKLRLLVATTLRENGYDVIEVQDGGRLLVHIAGAYAGDGRRAVCDIVVSDVRMPICSGIQILEGLRRAHWTTPVILMTAFRDETTRALAKSLRATLLEKPFGLDELLQAVLNLLPGRGSG